MPKIHTRVLRRFRMRRTSQEHAPRSRTFSSEENAKKYAKENGITKFRLEDLCEAKPNKHKIRIIEE